jgi:hypothetical protein
MQKRISYIYRRYEARNMNYLNNYDKRVQDKKEAWKEKKKHYWSVDMFNVIP